MFATSEALTVIHWCTPRIFDWKGWGVDPEAMYNLFDFKNCVIKIML
jgi:hypothetical protein